MYERAEHFREIVEGLDFTLQSILCKGLLFLLVHGVLTTSSLGKECKSC